MVYSSSVKLKVFGDCILKTVVFASAVHMDECSNSHKYSSSRHLYQIGLAWRKCRASLDCWWSPFSQVLPHDYSPSSRLWVLKMHIWVKQPFSGLNQDKSAYSDSDIHVSLSFLRPQPGEMPFSACSLWC